MAIMAKASAKTKAIIIAVKTLGALEGFLAKASMLASELAAKTAQGPKTHKPKIITREIFRPIFLNLLTACLFYDCRDIILVNLDYAPFDGYGLVVDKELTGNQTADQAFVKGEDFKYPLLSGKGYAFGLPLKKHFLKPQDLYF